MREWQDLHGQLRQIARSIGLEAGALGDADAAVDSQRVHSALLAGLLSHVGVREGEARDYLGARGSRFAVNRGSSVAKQLPRFVVAGELVETNRLWARTVARIEPEWVEPLAQHLVLKVHSEPHWDPKRGAVMAYERVTLFGVPLVARRRIGYHDVDPELCREMFIRHALVEGQWRTHHAFFRQNLELLESARSLEEKARRRDLTVDEETLFALYDARLPAEAVSARHFDAWWKAERRAHPDRLTFTLDELLTAAAGEVSAADYPEVWSTESGEFSLAYEFEPGAATDGVTVQVPVSVLAQVGAGEFEWPVPGLRHDLVVALLRSLPKSIRRALVPVPDTARAVLAQITPGQEPLLDALERAVRHVSDVVVPREAWDWDEGSRPPAADLPGGLRRRGRAGRGQGPRAAASRPRRRGPGRGRRRVGRPGAQRAHRVARRTWTRSRGSPGAAARATWSRASRPWWTRVPRGWRCGCWRPPPSRRWRTGAAPGRCCCSRCPTRPRRCRRG